MYTRARSAHLAVLPAARGSARRRSARRRQRADAFRAQETDLGPALTLLFCCCLLLIAYLIVAECNQAEERSADQERVGRSNRPAGAPAPKISTRGCARAAMRGSMGAYVQRSAARCCVAEGVAQHLATIQRARAGERRAPMHDAYQSYAGYSHRKGL